MISLFFNSYTALATKNCCQTTYSKRGKRVSSTKYEPYGSGEETIMGVITVMGVVTVMGVPVGELTNLT